jgi:hypothetical protein
MKVEEEVEGSQRRESDRNYIRRWNQERFTSFILSVKYLGDGDVVPKEHYTYGARDAARLSTRERPRSEHNALVDFMSAGHWDYVMGTILPLCV